MLEFGGKKHQEKANLLLFCDLQMERLVKLLYNVIFSQEFQNKCIYYYI